MSRLPDLVHDTRLNTLFKDGITIHHYDESDDENDARSTLRSEHWEQTSHLGHGGYGDVWLQQCVSGKRGHERRAVKIIPRLRFKDKKDSYMAELEAIAKFSQRRYSKCFVKLIGWYDTDSSLYIAMEYVPLGDLEKYMSGNGPMQEADAQQVSFQILEGLSYMHREGFAHRDVKPGNVLIKSHPPKSKWWVKISDFGISKRVEGSKAQSTVRGTIQYMAPELIWHEAGNPINYMAADMWALGTMVYRMLTLMPVFTTPGAYNYYLVNVNSFPLEQLKKQDASSDAILFIRSLMGPRPEERLSSDKAMGHAWVASFKSNQTQIPTSPEPPSSYDYSASRQSAPTSDLNPWATVSTSSADTSIEAQQPRNIFTRSALPISAPQTPATIASQLERNRALQREIQREIELRSTDNQDDRAANRRGRRKLRKLDVEEQSLKKLLKSTSEEASRVSSPGRFGGLAQIKVAAPDAQVIPPAEYPYRAKAIYSYKANPENDNEISFGLDEILEVFDVSEEWWPARNKEGQEGIAPSNYLELLRQPPAHGMLKQRVHDIPSTDTDSYGSESQGSSRADSRGHGEEPRSFFANPSLSTAKPMNTTVLVNNIPSRIPNNKIRDTFSFCGEITDLQVTTEDNMKRAKVTYDKETTAELALRFNNQKLGPNTITVVKASEQEAADTGSQGSYWASIKTSLAEVFERPEIDVPKNAP